MSLTAWYSLKLFLFGGQFEDEFIQGCTHYTSGVLIPFLLGLMFSLVIFILWRVFFVGGKE